MCGRFTLSTKLSDIKRTFNIKEVEAAPEASYNIAPTQPVAVVVARDGVNTLESMRWGLIPFWAKDQAIGSKMINARAETLTEKPAFKRPFKSQRCLVVADGFYEWRKVGTKKIPMFVRLKSKRPFGFAGLYDTWKTPEGDHIASCTIITTPPNALLKPIHDRMPVIIPKDEYELWLDSTIQDVGELMPLLQPYSAKEMEAYEVSRMVNSPANNSPECIAPVAS